MTSVSAESSDAAVRLDWNAADREENIEASRQDEDGLRQMLSAITTKASSPRPDEIKQQVSARAAELD